MNFSNFGAQLAKTACKGKIFFKKNGPAIMVVLGTAGIVTAAVISCIKTPKAVKVIEEHREKMDDIHENRPDSEVATKEEMGDYCKTLVRQYADTAWKVTKVYALSVGIVVISSTLIFTGVGILGSRCAKAIAGGAAISEEFARYRNNVKGELGKEADDHFRYGTEWDGEHKPEPKNDISEETADETKNDKMNGISPWSKFFAEDNPNWDKDAEHSLFFLQQQQAWLNDRLRRRGHLTLNEAYEAVGLDPTEFGATNGWIYDPSNPEHHGDNCVDFGIFGYGGVVRDRALMFVNGEENCILLNFNIDGFIADKLIGGKY